MADIKGKSKHNARKRRQLRVRSKIHGTAERPRMNVYRSLDNIYVQVINDDAGQTVVSASTIDRDVAKQIADKSKTDAARLVGKIVAERAKEAGINTVVFDRSGFRYHGRVAALAEGAREAGLKF
jgi:large subunit ribosomal protein L18